METTRKTTEQEKEVMEFLNLLRNTGATNMFGATPYIMQEFDIPKQEASKLLVLWMDNFNEEGKYDDVKSK
jgi:hypothetical protein